MRAQEHNKDIHSTFIRAVKDYELVTHTPTSAQRDNPHQDPSTDRAEILVDEFQGASHGLAASETSRLSLMAAHGG